MDVQAGYSTASALWHFTQAIPLILWPQAIIGLLNVDTAFSSGFSDSSVPSIEVYFARSLGLALAALGLVSLLLSGLIPLGSIDDGDAAPAALAPYSSATTVLSFLHHFSTAFYTWARYSSTSQTGFLLGSVGSAVLASWGLWCAMFGSVPGRVSKRTGADKRTSGWPFRNLEADKRKGDKGGRKEM